MASNTSDFFTFSKTAGTAKNLQKPTDGGDNNLWGGFINVDLDTIVGAVNAPSDLIADANQNELVDFTATGSAVNHVGITNAATGNGPTIEAKGDDTNIDLNVSGKGTGKLATTSPKITTGINDSNNNELIKVTATGSAVNEITVANAATGDPPEIQATGDDTNINIKLTPKGSGSLQVGSVTDASVPQNLVAYRASGVSTPSGWSEYTSVRGRMIVGLPSGGTDGNTVGTALTNSQDKSKELSHNHASASHFHLLPYDNEVNKVLGRSTPYYGQSSVSSSIQPTNRLSLDGTADTTTNYARTEDVTPGATGTKSGADVTVNTSDVLAYIQLMAIKKD